MALSPNWIKDVHARDKYRCVYCDFDMSSFEGWQQIQTDHFVPRSKGGTDDVENLKTSCIACNFLKRGAVFPDLKTARVKLAQWRESSRAFWEENVKPFLDAMGERGRG